MANHGRHRCKKRRLGSATTPEEANNALARQERINKVRDCSCFDIFRHGELQLDLVRVDGSRLGLNTVPHLFAFELLSFDLKLYLLGLGCFPLRLGYRPPQGYRATDAVALDDDTLFYFASRGMDEKTAERVKTRAKLERICRRIPDAQSREETENLLKTVMNDGQDD